MIRFVFRLLFVLFILGMVTTLALQYWWRKEGTAPVVRETNSADPGVIEPNDGPAEKAGAFVDRGLNTLGRVTETASEELQRATGGEREPEPPRRKDIPVFETPGPLDKLKQQLDLTPRP